MGTVGVNKDALLHAVSSAVLAVTRHLSPREVLQVIVRSARELLDARYAALGVPDDDGSFAEFVADGITLEQWAAIGPTPGNTACWARCCARARRSGSATSGAIPGSTAGRRPIPC